MSFLIDTDICSAYMKGLGKVTNRFLQYGGRLYLSTVTLGELCAWSMRATAPPHRKLQLLNLLRVATVLDIDGLVAHRFGDVRAWQLDHGVPSPLLDLLNASVALVHGYTLVTHNTADFQNVPGLLLADWLVP